MDGFVAELRKIPPVTRILCGSSLGVTLSVLLNVVSPYTVLFLRDLVVKRFQIWRLYTSFFLGGGGINYIFELFMLYRTAEQLESGPYSRRSADLAYQLLFAGASIIALTSPLSALVFTRPLLLCLTYLSSALAPPGAQTSLMGLISLPITYLPYVMVGFDLLMAGPNAAAQAVAGAVVGHFWWWGVWGPAPGGQGGVLQAFARAPQWLRNFMGESGAPLPPGVVMGGGVNVIPPRRGTTGTTTTGARGGSGSGSGGYNWGSGRTLGSS